MDFEVDEHYRAIIGEAQAVADLVEPFAAEADASNDVHSGVLSVLRASRLGELTVPAEFGGRFERVDPLAVCLAREVLMATSSHLDSLFALQGIGSHALVLAGNASQQETWLPKVARLESLAALAITEEGAGSDVRAISTTLSHHRNGLELNGEKTFISNAGAAAFYTVLAREGDGFSTVLVPGDSAGITIEPAPELIAPHVLGTVRFDGVTVGEDQRLGSPGEGMDLVLSTLAVFRVSVAGAALGLAQAALAEAVRHTSARQQFGRPLIRQGPVSVMLADSWTELESCRLLTYRAATLAKTDPLSNLHHSSMAKLAATEMASRVTDRCVQVMGRWGVIRDAKVERLYRQARPMRIYEGASDVLRLGIAKALGAELAEQ